MRIAERTRWPSICSPEVGRPTHHPQFYISGPVALKMAKLALMASDVQAVNDGLALEEICYAQVIPTEDRLEGGGTVLAASAHLQACAPSRLVAVPCTPADECAQR